MDDAAPPEAWGPEEVGAWLRGRGHSAETATAFQQHEVDGRALALLGEEDLKELGLRLVGPRKRLVADLAALLGPRDRAMAVQARVPSSSSSDCGGQDHARPRPSLSPVRIAGEPWKTALAFLYMNIVFVITACVLVIAHERLPSTDAYPPLPDLLLDNLPYVPWAFEAAEGIAVILTLLWTGILACHRHRCILLRRMFSLAGTVFLLRSVTMIITSLSAPGRHLKTQCVHRPAPTWTGKLLRAFHIWRHLGMSIHGVKTCGDYMFSGHTVALTLLNFFITEYTPPRWYYVHTFSWLLNIFGVFFILAAHEHYSIDVFVAFYISSRLFLYYHTLANNRSLMIRDMYRTRIWFPLFYFFESGCDGIVPNEYELPVPGPLRRLMGRAGRERRRKAK